MIVQGYFKRHWQWLHRLLKMTFIWHGPTIYWNLKSKSRWLMAMITSAWDWSSTRYFQHHMTRTPAGKQCHLLLEISFTKGLLITNWILVLTHLDNQHNTGTSRTRILILYPLFYPSKEYRYGSSLVDLKFLMSRFLLLKQCCNYLVIIPLEDLPI